MKTFYILTSTAATLLSLACSRQESGTSARDTASGKGRQKSAARSLGESSTLSGGAAFTWQAGDTACFTMEAGFAFGAPDINTPVPDPAKEGMTIRGIYHLAVLAVDEHSVQLAAAFSGGIVQTRGERSAIFEELVNSTPAVITMDLSGSVRGIAFPADLPDEDRHVLRAIYGWEFISRQGSATWTAKEVLPGSASSFLATYSSRRDGSVTKVRNFIAGSDGPTQEIVASAFEGKAGRCWLDYLRGRECSIVMSDGEPMGTTMAQIAIERSAMTSRPDHFAQLVDSPPPPGAFTETPAPTALCRLSAAAKMQLAQLREKYRNVPYEELFLALQNAAKANNHTDALPVLHAFRDMLQARPDLGPRVAESLRSGVSPELSSLLTHALELANTEATQGTLADILGQPDQVSPTVLVQAIVAAGALGPLKDQRISDVLDMLQSRGGGDSGDYSPSDAALFSLSRLSVTNPALKEQMLSLLTPQLEGSDPENCQTALLALANGRLATPQILDRAETLLHSQEPATRAAALNYFERLPELDANQLKSVVSLLKDPDPGVQLQAVEALAPLHSQEARPEGLAALESIANDAAAEDGLRNAARNALARSSAHSPQ